MRFIEREAALIQEISDLKSYADVSVVKSLTTENAELKSELAILRKKLSQADETTSRASFKTMKVQAQHPMERQQRLEEQQQQEMLQQEQQHQEQQRQEQQRQEQQRQEQQRQEQQRQEQQRQEQQEQRQPRQRSDVESTYSRASRATARTAVTAVPEPSEYDGGEFPEFVHQSLNSGDYYWDPSTCDLYSIDANGVPLDQVGKLKVVKIRGAPYYIDTVDNTVYEQRGNSDVGPKCGSLVNGKAIFDRKPPQ
jgi:multidrug efflux pump subunit AcrA (membrane-fusion protein)